MNFTMMETYWFARGYYDGRAKGSEDETLERLEPMNRHAYRSGYESGVADHDWLDTEGAE